MITGATIRSKRSAAGIAGHIVCGEVEGLSRTRLSELERGYVKAKPDELNRINKALDALIAAKAAIRKTAIDAGWPGTAGVGL